MNIWQAFVGLLEQVLLTFDGMFRNLGLPGAAGLAIILFTILARLLILPLTLKSLQSNRKMQELQPQLQELRRKYGKDQQKFTEESMKLYREYKINPAGGCLPILVQLPIFFAVYQAVIQLAQVSTSEHVVSRMAGALAANGANVLAVEEALNAKRLLGGFLWIPDLGSPDPLFILGVLSIIFQLIVQLMATPRVQDPQQKAIAQSMLVMPLMFGYLGFTFPAGAVLYWVVGSVFSMVQQYVISGWGSLANYLRFLPTDKGLMKPIAPVAAAESAAASGTAGVVAPDAPRQSFWDVMRPLMEQGQEEAPTTSPATEPDIAGERVRPTSPPITNPRRRTRPRR